MGLLDILFGRLKNKSEIHVVSAGSHKREREFQLEQKCLSKKFGGAPSNSDVHWAIFNKELVEHSKRQNWGLYRNTRFNMAEQLRGERKFKAALDTYCEVSYLDANGPRNLNGFVSPEFPPFSKDLAFQAPAVVSLIAELAQELGLRGEELKSAYLVVARRFSSAMKLPRTPEEGWGDIDKDLIIAEEAIAESIEVGEWFKKTKAKTLELIPKNGIKESQLHRLVAGPFSGEDSQISSYRITKYTEEFQKEGLVRREKVGRNWIVFKT